MNNEIIKIICAMIMFIAGSAAITAVIVFEWKSNNGGRR